MDFGIKITNPNQEQIIELAEEENKSSAFHFEKSPSEVDPDYTPNQEESRKTALSNNLFHLGGQNDSIIRKSDAYANEEEIKEGTESFLTANEEDKKDQ